MDRRDKQFARGRQPGLEHTRYAIGRGIDPKHPRSETQHHNTVQVHNNSKRAKQSFPPMHESISKFGIEFKAASDVLTKILGGCVCSWFIFVGQHLGRNGSFRGTSPCQA
jgi:hypothetical protein